jgi:hypothetical protein
MRIECDDRYVGRGVRVEQVVVPAGQLKGRIAFIQGSNRARNREAPVPFLKTENAGIDRTQEGGGRGVRREQRRHPAGECTGMLVEV